MTAPIHGMMATQRRRKHLLHDVIDSIIDQVDDLFVYLNDYSTDEFLELRKELPSKCVLMLGKHEKGDIKDNGKFYKSGDLSDWHFTLDDDLLYPADYVDRMIEKCESHDRKVAVSAHGRIAHAPLPLNNYYKDTSTLHFSQRISRDTFVHFVGTGCTAYHRDHIMTCIDKFHEPNMADVWFMKICEENDVPRLVISHEENWVTQHPDDDTSESIYFQHRGNCDLQTQIANEYLS